MKINYSMNLSPPPPKPRAPAPVGAAHQLVRYAFSDFRLMLPAHWRQELTPQDSAFHWSSEMEGAAITVGFEFYEAPQDQWQSMAERALDLRHQAQEKAAPGQVTVIRRTIKPFAAGAAIEMRYAAAKPDQTYFYLGYISGRKLFNFVLTCGPDRQAATALFDQFMHQRLSVKLP